MGHFYKGIITPLTRVAFVYNGPKGMELAPNPHYSGGSKALGGSFKLVTLAPKTIREMTHCSEGSFLPITWQVMTT